MFNYKEAQHDAGLLREYIVKNYGGALTFGGMSASYNWGMRQVKRLSRMTGLSQEQVLADIRSDYFLSEDF